MPRYIDADAMLSKIKVADDFVGKIDGQTLKAWINSQPTIDVAPVVHAHWVHRTAEWNFTEECPKCHFGHDYRTPFCPICGAKMDEEVDNE